VITVTLVIDVDEDTQERITCGKVEFKYSPDQPKILYLDKEMIEVAGGKKLFFSATYEMLSENVSVFIKEDELHTFTAVFNWSYAGTYFAFRLSDSVFTELYFTQKDVGKS
jgi:hypothetical protein